MIPRRSFVYLTDEELMLLDGRCSEGAQEKVDEARNRISHKRADLPSHITDLIADAVWIAKKSKKLTWMRMRIHHCAYCRRYETNSNFPGVDLHRSFVRMERTAGAGGCLECVEAAKPHLIQSLRKVRAELPDELRAKGATKWKRYHIRECRDCGWKGHDGELHKTARLARCPGCQAGSLRLRYTAEYEVVKEGDHARVR